MIYNWSYNDINNDISKIKEIINNEENMYKKSLYKYILDRVEEEYSCVFINNHVPKLGMQSHMIDLNSTYLLNRRYYELINNFNSVIDNNENIYNEILSIYLKIKNCDNYSIPDNKCIEIVSDVFFNLDNKFSNLYREFYKNINQSVKFNNEYEDSNYDGFCINIGILDKNYILVKDNKGISKAINLAHEIGHVLAFRYNTNKTYYARDEFLDEVPSIFFELVFEYEYSYHHDSIGTSMFNFDNYYSIINTNDKLLFHKTILDEWVNNEYEINDNYYNIIKGKYNLNRKDSCDIIKCNICNNGKYNIGYLVALHLFHIYKKDKNDALMLLRTILNLREKDTYILINQILNYDYINEEVYTILNSINEDFKKRLTLR